MLHGLGDALAAVPRGEVALALRHGVDGLVAGGDEAAGACCDAALERGEGGVPAHLEVAPAGAACAAGLEEHLDARDLGEAGDLVEREAAGELDPRGDGGAADVAPGGHGAGDAGGAVGAGEVPAALEEAEDGGGGARRGGGGGLVELGGAGLRGERAGEGGDGRGQRAAREALVGAALVDERVEVGARHGRRRVEEEEEDGGGQQLKPARPAHRESQAPLVLGISRPPLSALHRSASPRWWRRCGVYWLWLQLYWRRLARVSPAGAGAGWVPRLRPALAHHTTPHDVTTPPHRQARCFVFFFRFHPAALPSWVSCATRLMSRLMGKEDGKASIFLV